MLAIVSLGLADAMLGSVAAPAEARPRPCSSIMGDVYEYWAMADIYTAEGLEASEHGDWLAAGYYTYMAAESELNGNDFYAQAMAMGC